MNIIPYEAKIKIKNSVSSTEEITLQTHVSVIHMVNYIQLSQNMILIKE